jgi:ribosome-binding factor A
MGVSRARAPRAGTKRETCVMGKTKQQHRSRRRDERDEGGEGGYRTARLQELIREELNLILRNEVRDPRLDGVIITMVELAGDGSRARLWYTAEGDEDRREACDHIAGFLRTQLAESLGLKRTPELRFRRDPASRTFALDGAET